MNPRQCEFGVGAKYVYWMVSPVRSMQPQCYTGRDGTECSLVRDSNSDVYLGISIESSLYSPDGSTCVMGMVVCVMGIVVCVCTEECSREWVNLA